MIEKVDAASRRWPAPLRWLYLGIKWYLVFAGAAVLLIHWSRTFGWPVVAWFIGVPFLMGLLGQRLDGQ